MNKQQRFGSLGAFLWLPEFRRLMLCLSYYRVGHVVRRFGGSSSEFQLLSYKKVAEVSPARV